MNFVILFGAILLWSAGLMALVYVLRNDREKSHAHSREEEVADRTPVRRPIGARITIYAGFWRRFVAALIDGIILAIAVVSVGLIFSFEEEGEIRGSILGLLVSWLYYALQESSPSRATLGKKALGITVTDLNGNRISFGRATGRHFGKVLSAIILYVGFLMAGFTEKKQALHDMMAGCLVIKKR